jgi:ABC-type transporter Mla MlaB component
LSDIEHNLVVLAGNVTVSSIFAAHAEMGGALRQHAPVIVDISGVTEVDLTFIQLLEAARRAAADKGQDLTLRHPADGAVLEILRRGGFLDDDTSDRSMFWLQGEVGQ